MNELLSRPMILLALSLILLIAAGSFIADIPEIINNRTIDKSKSPLISTGSIDFIDQALKETVRHDFFTYIGDFENPFRLSLGGRVSNENKSAPPHKIERVKLQLKGLLNKEKPLAILEDERGMTYILGVGDSVTNQMVHAISGSKVTIVDSKGKYEIVVEEE